MNISNLNLFNIAITIDNYFLSIDLESKIQLEQDQAPLHRLSH